MARAFKILVRFIKNPVDLRIEKGLNSMLLLMFIIPKPIFDGSF